MIDVESIDWGRVIDDPPAVLKEIGDRISSDVLVRRYIESLPGLDFTKGAKRTASDILARRTLWTLTLIDPDNLGKHTAKEMACLALLTESAIPYFWDALLFEMTAISEMPPHIIERGRMPFQYMWIAFDRQIAIEGIASQSDSIFLMEADNCLVGVTFGVEDGLTKVQKIPVLPYGTQFHDAHAPWPQLLSAVSFTESPYVVNVQGGLNRRERKNAGRGRAIEAELQEIVNFITLRRADYQEASDDAGKPGVDWKHRWLVRCHRRSQWYPSLQSHKIIWVKAHVKGPESAPLKQPVYRVNR